MKAKWKDTVMVDSSNTIVIEGTHYFPHESVDKAYLAPSDYHTTCFWKGEASYYNVVVDGQTNDNAAWYYAQPLAGAIQKVGYDFTNYIAFWRGVEVSE